MPPRTVRLLSGAGMLLAAVPFVIALGMTLFRLFGQAEEGQVQFDLYTPELGELLMFEGACVLLFGACLVARLRFGKGA